MNGIPFYFNSFKQEYLKDVIDYSKNLIVPQHILKPPHVINNSNYKASNQLSIIKTKEELENLKYCSQISSSILSIIIEKVEKKELQSGEEVNNFFNDYVIKRNCYPSSLGFYNFPKSLCISINDGNKK